MTLLTSSRPCHDQARELRALVAQRAAMREADSIRPRSCRSVVVASGKGGVGKSVIAMNLAMALIERGDSVCLVDASSRIGHIGLLSGQHRYWNLSHVASGSRCLSEVVVDGPGGLKIVPGGISLLEESESFAGMHAEFRDLESQHDWLIIDTGSGMARETDGFIRAADHVLVVTTPDPAAIAEAYAVIKQLPDSTDSRASVLVNRAASYEMAHDIWSRLRHASRSFLQNNLGYAGIVLEDSTVGESVLQQCSLNVLDTDCEAMRGLRQVAARMEDLVVPQADDGYFGRLWLKECVAIAGERRVST